MLREKAGRRQLLTGYRHREAPGTALQSLNENLTGGVMPDFARKPTHQQAVRLGVFAARIRFLKFVFGFNWRATKG